MPYQSYTQSFSSKDLFSKHVVYYIKGFYMDAPFKWTTLYIATHNITGLKYFGKSSKYFTEEDLQNYYHGSGTYWRRHLNIHGDDVTMKIHLVCLEKHLEEFGVAFSTAHNIVHSKAWANLISETGKGSCAFGEKNPNYDNTWSQEQRKQASNRMQGFVSVRNTITGITSRVSLEEWKATPELVALSKGRHHTLDIDRHGSKNSNAKHYTVYDSCDTPMFHIFGNFKEVCTLNNLPYGQLVISANSNGKPLYQKKKPQNSKYQSFIGWYVLKDHYDNYTNTRSADQK